MIFSGIFKYKKCIKNAYKCIVSENPNLYLMPKMQIQNSQKSFVNAAVICSLGYKIKIKQVTEVIYMRTIYLTTWGLKGSSCYPWFKFENWDAKVSSCTARSLPTANEHKEDPNSHTIPQASLKHLTTKLPWSHCILHISACIMIQSSEGES